MDYSSQHCTMLITMGENTEISWCDHTYNPWEGCFKISPGCQHCYADTQSRRVGRVRWGKGELRYRPKDLNAPLKWNKQSAEVVANGGPRLRIFSASMADILDDEVDQQWQTDLWAMVERTPHLDWLLLTKRPENVKRLPPSWLDGDWPCNAWFGVSVEDQQRADRRIPLLLKLPAPIKFLSVEPLLGPVSIDYWVSQLQWVIVGGESGPKARPMHPTWARSVRDACAKAGVPFFFKQHGQYRYAEVVESTSGVPRFHPAIPGVGNQKMFCFPTASEASIPISNNDDLWEHAKPGTVMGFLLGKTGYDHDVLDGHHHLVWPNSLIPHTAPTEPT